MNKGINTFQTVWCSCFASFKGKRVNLEMLTRRGNPTESVLDFTPIIRRHKISLLKVEISIIKDSIRRSEKIREKKRLAILRCEHRVRISGAR